MRSPGQEYKMVQPNQDAAKPRTRENDNLKPGQPPRPATEPPGSAGSSRNSQTLTDPATGAPSDAGKP
jgi:hypothetical protein